MQLAHTLSMVATETAWLLAVGWVWRAIATTAGLGRVPDLRDDRFSAALPSGTPLAIIVPARNEATSVERCLRSLLTQRGVHLRVVAVDDRSTDETPAILDRVAMEFAGVLEVLHVQDLPRGWLGKPHAMALAADHAIATYQPRWLLFTDADVFFAPEALSRALAAAEQMEADHFVLLPTTTIRRWDEAVFLSFFSTFSVLAGQPWKVVEPRAREHIGVGAFNMIRTDAYQTIGGIEPLRMTIVEDITLGRLVKAAGFRQAVATGPGLVSLHWAAGLSGLTNVMTKNLFAAMNYRLTLVLLFAGMLCLLFVAPFAGLLVVRTAIPSAIAVAAMVWSYRAVGRRTGMRGWLRNALLAPMAALAFVFALLRSTAVTLRQGGVIWRGTFYPLADLRRDGVSVI